jgi:iron complex outermembrane receptor protein
MRSLSVFLFGFLLSMPAPRLGAQASGRIEGVVVLARTGDPLHAATVHLDELGRTAQTNHEGRFRFDNVPPGSYHLHAHADIALTEAAQTVTVVSGQTTTVKFELNLSTVREKITVTATGVPQTAFESFQSVDARNSFDLASEIAPTIGETLANRPGNGVAKRSFGPGTERPIIRGFDGDRVLILQDGIRTGTLSSQSGDHAELVNTGGLDRLEVVKGPATLLYGGSAMGGVVNAITRHHAFHEHPHQGLRGYISGTGGSANSFANGSAGFEYGFKHWMIWGGGSGQRSGDYHTPIGRIPNSDTRLSNGYGGFGWYGKKHFLSATATYDKGLYGVPFANLLHGHDEEEEDNHEEESDDHEHELVRTELDTNRQAYQFNWGVKAPARSLDNFVLRLNYTRWRHDEIEVADDGHQQTGTRFDNRQFIYRGVFEQAPRGILTGRFGFWGMVRDYKATGEEALSPPVDQHAVAAFALEELNLERFKFQFGARLEHNRYRPDAAPEVFPKRSFTGASASAGVNVSTWQGGAFVANYSRSYRAPALEELYNEGPHVGNLAFEVGDPDLKAETGNGIDLSLRHRHRRAHGEFNFFYYDFQNFIFPFATGETRHGFQEIQFAEADSRFVGSEANLGLGLHRYLWLNLGMDYVNAQEKAHKTPLPRIPPLRSRAGLEWNWQGFSIEPEMILAHRQDRTFTGETETAGYAVFNLRASYTIPRGHFMHQFAVNTFNIGDRLYRNHSSFIKDLAPEIGRGVRFTYRVRFF